MRYRNRVVWLGLLAALLLAPGQGRAQSYEVPGISEPNIPVPLGNSRMESGGFYTGLDFLFLVQNKTIGSQTVAYRGLFDFTGNLAGSLNLPRRAGQFLSPTPGLTEALNTDDLGRTEYMPGFRLRAGYKFENGTSVYASYLHMFDASYSAGATSIPPGYNFGNGLLGSFLSSGVVNFSSRFNGPTGIGDAGDTGLDRPQVVGIIPLATAPITIVRPDGTRITVPLPADSLAITTQSPGNTAGIWNAADVMSISFKQRYDQVEFGGRVPVFDSEYARSYGLIGGKFSWFYDKFEWRTVDEDILGRESAIWTADYSNILSQRMYGPFVGCGEEIYLGQGLALSADLTGSLLYNVIKQRVKYERQDGVTSAKRSNLDYSLVPNGEAHINLWWYPIEGVQITAGYNAMMFFNTWGIDQAIGFDMGAIDPVYNRHQFRILHGFNVGLTFSF